MLQENLIKIYETSFRDNREMPALTDYFKGETFSYYEMAKEERRPCSANYRSRNSMSNCCCNSIWSCCIWCATGVAKPARP